VGTVADVARFYKVSGTPDAPPCITWIVTNIRIQEVPSREIFGLFIYL